MIRNQVFSFEPSFNSIKSTLIGLLESLLEEANNLPEINLAFLTDSQPKKNQKNLKVLAKTITCVPIFSLKNKKKTHHQFILTA